MGVAEFFLLSEISTIKSENYSFRQKILQKKSNRVFSIRYCLRSAPTGFLHAALLHLYVSDDVRFTPKSGHWNSVMECPLCAKRDILHCSKECRYSITSSARAPKELSQCLHLIEQPMDGSCSLGPPPVSATSFIASNRSRRAFGTGVMREASSRPRYCNSSCALKPKKSGVH